MVEDEEVTTGVSRGGGGSREEPPLQLEFVEAMKNLPEDRT